MRGANGSDGDVSTKPGQADPRTGILRAMSEENVALIRRLYEVINSIGRTGEEVVDLEELAPDLWARLAPDFEMHGRPDVPDAQIYRGREAAKEFWGQLQQVFSELRW